jgi:micrococcal nuclease
MNSKKSLKNTSFYLLLGFCLVFVGFVIFSQKSQISLISPISLTTPTSLNSPTFARVTKVIDGDTIEIENGDRVRYIGINTPEVEISECYATEASEINKNLVLGKVVKLEKDVSETDKYGRLLRYVYVGDMFVDDYLVKNGYAKIETVPPDVEYKDEFLQSQNYAKENNLGLWKECMSIH